MHSPKAWWPNYEWFRIKIMSTDANMELPVLSFFFFFNIGWQKMFKLWSRGHDIFHKTNKVSWWRTNSVLWLPAVQVSAWQCEVTFQFHKMTKIIISLYTINTMNTVKQNHMNTPAMIEKQKLENQNLGRWVDDQICRTYN